MSAGPRVRTITEQEILAGLHDYGWDDARTCTRCGTPVAEAMSNKRKLRCKGKQAKERRMAAKKRTEGFHVSFEEVNALVASYMNEAKYDQHAAGNVVAKVMAERIRRKRTAQARRLGTEPRKGV